MGFPVVKSAADYTVRGCSQTEGIRDGLREASQSVRLGAFLFRSQAVLERLGTLFVD